MLRALPFIIVLIPFFGCIIVWRASIRSKQAGNIAASIICGCVLLLTCFMYPAVSSGKVLGLKVPTALPLPLYFRVDRLGLVLALVTCFLWFLASVYAVEYMKPQHAQVRYQIFSLVSLSSMLGIVLAGDLHYPLHLF